jgi:hypothetical protein
VSAGFTISTEFFSSCREHEINSGDACHIPISIPAIAAGPQRTPPESIKQFEELLNQAVQLTAEQPPADHLFNIPYQIESAQSWQDQKSLAERRIRSGERASVDIDHTVDITLISPHSVTNSGITNQLDSARVLLRERLLTPPQQTAERPRQIDSRPDNQSRGVLSRCDMMDQRRKEQAARGSVGFPPSSHSLPPDAAALLLIQTGEAAEHATLQMNAGSDEVPLNHDIAPQARTLSATSPVSMRTTDSVNMITDGPGTNPVNLAVTQQSYPRVQDERNLPFRDVPSDCITADTSLLQQHVANTASDRLTDAMTGSDSTFESTAASEPSAQSAARSQPCSSMQDAESCGEHANHAPSENLDSRSGGFSRERSARAENNRPRQADPFEYPENRSADNHQLPETGQQTEMLSHNEEHFPRLTSEFSTAFVNKQPIHGASQRTEVPAGVSTDLINSTTHLLGGLPAQLVGQLHQIQLPAGHDRQDWLIRLDPPELGCMLIRLRRVADGLAIDLAAADADVSAWLQQHEQLLQSQFEQVSDCSMQSLSVLSFDEFQDAGTGKNPETQRDPEALQQTRTSTCQGRTAASAGPPIVMHESVSFRA